MQNISLTDINKCLGKINFSNLPPLNISVLRNIMLEPIENYLRYYALSLGFKASVSFGEYDTVFQESVGRCPKLLNKNTDCILIFQYFDNLSLKLSREFTGLSKKEIECEIQRIKDEFLTILRGIRKQTNATILWHGIENTLLPAFGICDHQIKNSQQRIITNLNIYLQDLLNEVSNTYFVDMNLLLRSVGGNQFYDFRYWHIGRAPYSKIALHMIAFEDFKYIRALKGQNKKCLVLDCDNTIWGGIIGEDGLSGIKLSKTFPGSAFYEFQQEILNLYNRGIIIALCSKNNEADVWEVFENHPEMVLKKKHIAVAKINWDDKPTNLRKIAMELNIGIDSMVFIDDSEFEINLVKKELPEIEVIHLNKSKMVEQRNLLASCGLFDTLTLSIEDKERGAMYKAESDRKNLKSMDTDMDSYLRSLEMVIDIRYATEFSISRISQQTQKTNQFNLTTYRYNDLDIKNYMNSPTSDVITLQLTDQFGQSGIVGTCILQYSEKKTFINTFLLSCRVIGRGVEVAFLIHILRLAKKRGCKQVVGEYLRTKKNSQVEFFYLKNGFIESSFTEDKRIFFYDLSKKIETTPNYFQKINSELE